MKKLLKSKYDIGFLALLLCWISTINFSQITILKYIGFATLSISAIFNIYKYILIKKTSLWHNYLCK